MSYANQRALSGDLHEGLTDGGYKKIVRDRGGQVESTTHHVRSSLNDTWFGMHEDPLKHTPDGRAVTTPHYVGTPAPLFYPGM
ncbi:hypothetical protein [Streptomyces sp. NPDC088360]|uniref:hypothetical protein n=1 Tax=Streptomyces sp. NPDC088360 TaxID=3154515 RepID=UPI00344FD458